MIGIPQYQVVLKMRSKIRIAAMDLIGKPDIPRERSQLDTRFRIGSLKQAKTQDGGNEE